MIIIIYKNVYECHLLLLKVHSNLHLARVSVVAYA